MPTYAIAVTGRECFPDIKSLEVARATLKEMVEADMAACKKRYGKAYKHKLGEDSYSITLGPDHRSQLYSANSLLTFK